MVKVLIALLLSASTAHAAGLDETIARVDERFAEMRNFSATFRQTFFNASMGDTETSTGTMTVQKPMKMRWNYDAPYEQTIVADGQTLYFYVPRDRQVMVEPLGNVFDSRSPAIFLAGGKKLAELFRIELADDEKKDTMKGQTSLLLKPKEESVSVTKIVIHVDEADYTIRSFTLYDWVGNRTEIEFTEMKVNENLTNNTFTFHRPPGVETIEMPTLGNGSE